MVELMSKIIRNAQAGCRGDGNLIEQNDIFVQLREGRAREGGLFWRLFWQSERLPRLGALPSFYACHTRTVSISWENSPFLIARDIGRFPLRYMIPIYKTVENHAILHICVATKSRAMPVCAVQNGRAVLTRLEFGAECWPAAAIRHFSEGISAWELLNSCPWCGFVKSGPRAVSPSWNGNTAFQRFEKGAFLQLRKNVSLLPWP